jgi:hypothetical protein
MRVADEEDFDVSKLESKRFDAGTNEWNTRFEIAVDKNVAFGSCDQITCEVFASDVVKIAAMRNAGKGTVQSFCALLLVGKVKQITRSRVSTPSLPNVMSIAST